MYYAPLSDEEKPTPGPAARTLSAAGISAGRPLGAGKYGLVFEYGPGQVVKLSCRPDEARFAQWLRSTSDVPPGLAAFQQALELPAHLLEPPYWQAVTCSYVTIREELADLKGHDARLQAALDLVNTELMHGRVPSMAVLQLARIASGNAVALFDQVVSTLQWVQSKGASAGDLRVDNFGLRGTQLVVRDYDYWRPPETWGGSVPRTPVWTPPPSANSAAARPKPPSAGRRKPPSAEGHGVTAGARPSAPNMLSLPRSETWPPGARDDRPPGPQEIPWDEIGYLVGIGESLDGAVYVLERDGDFLVTLFTALRGEVLQLGGNFFGLEPSGREAAALRRAANEFGAVTARFTRKRPTEESEGIIVEAAGVRFDL